MKEKYILMSGAAGGIGRTTATLLAERGYVVFATDINKAALKQFDHERIVPVQVDITDVQSIEDAFTTITAFTKELHGLINMAGVFDHFALAEADSQTFERLIDVNFTGQQALTYRAFPLLKKVRGRIVNLSSETVLAPMPLQVYGFSKKLMDVWNTQLRMELKLLNMHVIAIRAGGHQTPFIRQSFDALGRVDGLTEYRKLKQKVMQTGQKMLTKKMSDPADISQAIYKALTAKKPKKYYHVNVSMLFRFLSLIPAGVREKLFIFQLKRWM